MIYPIKIVLGNQKVLNFLYFRKLGDEWFLTQDTLNELEAFTCLMYGYGREKSIDRVRAIMLRKMAGEDARMTTKAKIDLSRLPPCRANLTPHIQRVNHRLAHYKRANQVTFWSPKPYDPEQGWEGLLEPTWSNGPVLPFSLVDLVESVQEEDDDEDCEVDEELDYDEAFEDDNDD